MRGRTVEARLEAIGLIRQRFPLPLLRLLAKLSKGVVGIGGLPVVIGRVPNGSAAAVPIYSARILFPSICSLSSFLITLLNR